MSDEPHPSHNREVEHPPHRDEHLLVAASSEDENETKHPRHEPGPTFAARDRAAQVMPPPDGVGVAPPPSGPGERHVGERRARERLPVKDRPGTGGQERRRRQPAGKPAPGVEKHLERLALALDSQAMGQCDAGREDDRVVLGRAGQSQEDARQRRVALAAVGHHVDGADKRRRG